MTELQPDLILISVARRWLDRIAFDTVTPWTPIHALPSRRAIPYVFRVARMAIGRDRTSWIVSGPAAQRPFGKVSWHDQVLAAKSVKVFVDR